MSGRESIEPPEGTVFYRVPAVSAAIMESPIQLDDYEDTVLIDGKFSNETSPFQMGMHLKQGDDLYIIRKVEARQGRSVEIPPGEAWWWFVQLEALSELRSHDEGCECGNCGVDLKTHWEEDDEEEEDEGDNDPYGLYGGFDYE